MSWYDLGKLLVLESKLSSPLRDCVYEIKAKERKLSEE